MSRSNDCCKAYTIHAQGGELTLSETPDRLGIEVTTNVDGVTRAVYLSKAQFEMLCNMDSSFDGLKVDAAEEKDEVEVS